MKIKEDSITSAKAGMTEFCKLTGQVLNLDITGYA